MSSRSGSRSASSPGAGPVTGGSGTVDAASFYLETLGCPKNEVDSDKVRASLVADGLYEVGDPTEAGLIVVNTCAFIEAARLESIEVTLALTDLAADGAQVVVTGCLAERYGDELAAELPEVAAVIGFAGEGSIATTLGIAPSAVTGRAPAVPVALKRKPKGVRDLLELPRSAAQAPWAYVKIAEGCDRACAFCAIPSFRGKQRSRSPESIFAEARQLVASGVREIVLVAQDLAWYGRDLNEPGALAPLLRQLDALSADGLARVRLLYLYPSEVHDPLVSTMLELPTVVPYFDLSLQHASAAHLRRMKRWGSGDRFVEIIGKIRAEQPDAAFRSSFIVGFPGETEDDHDELIGFLRAAELDWAGFFTFSREEGTAAATMDGEPPPDLVEERLRECSDVQDPITARARDQLLECTVEVLVEDIEQRVVVGRTHREAPEIDGVVRIEWGRAKLPPIGSLVDAKVESTLGPDLEAVRA